MTRRRSLLHETGGETNDSNEDESSENEALSIIQETSEQDITENIELPQVNVDVHQTSTSGHPIPQSTSLNIESDVYNTSEQNTKMFLGSELNNESYNKIFEDYSPPPYQANMDAEENLIDDNFSWILLWIMNYRITYNIPETATESLIKFMKIVLNEISGENFRTFPDSLYLAKKVLGLKNRFQRFVPCTKCHKLYNKQDVENFHQNESLSVMKCHHIEFPNSSR
ncbi:hypothetical protein GLOIN_2v1480991 [Rhizophagus irregularis DAOM 181602=DAOM 197198]|nr:hypothetical protein GLOIN_2v1480991 [Rhizophagus irregularis DAOM 181602=DAOM 197198]